ncbi:Integral membrane protein [Serinicoccus hydrothermalis]|uniref:Integral membrane protein n=1 Tax=Serinicoccus hydrothermalis TaxID=1758689 RepID=A0A1B1NGH3_9MICO|nr:endonuclease/exonuclease/phosphatase family protein [Serinicoccus hydrothermalis]ANS80525.1 Integral membrane protein [Serinicoccus hydrothermalis]
MRRVLVTLAWTWWLAAAGLTALRWVDAAGPVPVLQSGLVLVGLSLVPLAALAWASARWLLLVAAVLLGLVHGALAAPWLVPDTVPAGRDDLVVAAANLEYGRGSLEDLAALVDERQVDALVLVEMTPEAQARLEGTALDRALPVRAGTLRSDAGGTLVLAREGVGGGAGVATGAGGADVIDEPYLFDQVRLPITRGEQTVTLLGAHTRPPSVAGSAAWREELGWLGADAAGLEGPLLVVGDLNASTGHPALRQVKDDAGLRDAHEDSGSGWVRTWPTEGLLPAFVQIDHVLVRGLEVVDAGAATVSGSDHATVWARLRLP